MVEEKNTMVTSDLHCFGALVVGPGTRCRTQVITQLLVWRMGSDYSDYIALELFDWLRYFMNYRKYRD